MPLFVNGESVDEALIEEESKQLRPRMFEAMADENPNVVEKRVREWARENVIERLLLRQAAVADPEPIDAELLDGTVERIKAQTPGQSGCILPGSGVDFRGEVEAQLRLERLLARITEKLSPPRNKDVTEYYRKHRESFFAPELVHASHIVKNVDEQTDDATALDHIRRVQDELKQGAIFEQLADECSDCPGRGGDLGWFGRGHMVSEFENVVFNLKNGEISEIFRTPFGYHIAKLHERKAAGIRTQNEVKDEIEAILYNEKKQRAIERYIDRLRATAEIATVSAVGKQAP
jgi:parvulin-like peptidyl-prolyl isomerase